VIEGGRVQVRIVEQATHDAKWDEFLMIHVAGHHLQSSLWGQLKAKFGWEVIRILVEEENQIVGGAQILTRQLPIWGGMGYISKGPVVAPGRADVMKRLFDYIEQTAQDRRMIILSIQPSADDYIYMQSLQECQFQPSSFYIVPNTTVLVDLRQSDDEILAQMRKSTRYSVRLASRKGITVREGNETDLHLFFKWAQADAARDPSYTIYDLSYYQEAWRQFAPHDKMKVLVAYYGDQPLGVTIVLSLGNWGVYKWGSSSGSHRKKMPNHLLQWEAIRWCKEKGCRYYDLGGITPSVAERIARGETIKPTDSSGAGIAYFKMGFGQLFTFPGSYDNSYAFQPKWLLRIALKYGWRLNALRKIARGV
jgi:peptidoglycan pentaglycine glycine transferase (the first glycine)